MSKDWLEKLGDIMLRSQTTSPTSVTGGDAYGARAMQAFSEGDVEKAKEIQQQEDAVGAMASLASVQLPMLGVSLATAPVQTTASLVFADQIGKQGKALGEKAAEKYGWNPEVSKTTGELLGNIVGGLGGWKVGLDIAKSFPIKGVAQNMFKSTIVPALAKPKLVNGLSAPVVSQALSAKTPTLALPAITPVLTLPAKTPTLALPAATNGAIRARNVAQILADEVPFHQVITTSPENVVANVYVNPKASFPYWRKTKNGIKIHWSNRNLQPKGSTPTFTLDLADPTKGVTFKTFSDFSNTVTDIVNRNTRNIISYLGPERVANNQEGSRQLILKKSIADLIKLDPSLGYNVSPQSIYTFPGMADANTKRFMLMEPPLSIDQKFNADEFSNSFAKVLRHIKSLPDGYIDRFADKRDRLRKYRALAKLMSNPSNQDRFIEEFKLETPKFSPELEKIIKDNYWEPYRDNLHYHLTQTGSEQEALIQTILDSHKVVRGVNMEYTDPTSVERALTEMNKMNGKGGRSDVPFDLIRGKGFGVLYTSNSKGTAKGYTYPSQKGRKGVGVIGKTREDLDLSGPMENWIKQNPTLQRLPTYRALIDPNQFYSYLATSTDGSRLISDIDPTLKKYVRFLSKEVKGANKLFNNLDDWRMKSETIRKAIRNLTIPKTKNYQVQHVLFFGPEGKSIEDAGYRLLDVQPTIKTGSYTRMHKGWRSPEFTWQFKKGGKLIKLK